MNDFEGLLLPDYGFKPQGKSAPMAANNSRSSSSSRSPGSFTGSNRIGHDSVSGAKINQKSQAFDEFGDISRKSELRGGGNSSINVDSMSGSASKSSSSMPVFDKPVYDDDIFERVPGLKSSSGVKYDNIFASRRETNSGQLDDLLAGLGKNKDPLKVNGSKNTDFDDLLPGFRSSPSTQRHTKEFDTSSRPTVNSNKKMGNRFMGNGSNSPHVLSFSGLSTDPLEEINKLGSSGSTKIRGQSATNMGLYDDLDPFDSFRKSMPTSATEKNNRVKDGSFLRADSSTGDSNRYSSRSTGNNSRGTTPVNRVCESQQTFFKIPRFLSFTRQSTIQNASLPSYENGNSTEANIHADGMESSDEVWLTVSEIPLFTQPTNAPPPSRPPPPRPARASKVASSSFGSRNGGLSSEELNMNSVAASSAAPMKEAMERAEAKFRHAKETWKGENSRSSRSRENVQLEKDESVEGVFREKQERLEHEWLERTKEEEEREHRRLEKERKQEEKEREQRRLEREMARRAVEKATREVHERAAAEACELTEKAAVQRAQAEARERAANEAKEKAERAAAEARDREARKKAAEARMQAERAAVQRAAAEARERAARDAREKAAAAAVAAAASASQQNNANDLDSIFNMGSQAPRTRASALESVFDAQFQSREGPGEGKTSATTQSLNTKKVSSTANFVDDLTSIFSGAASSREFQEVEGEAEERRRARLERHQRTQERAAKALAEKNQRDLQTQREQDERHRIAETLDIEIKRWATGKEGNLRALLSTLQYVLWPECGWQPVSLTDLITTATVRKFYRKATLCIHPDKVQQKGANLQQKYIAEKIFDLLKEAWNKFSSQELF